MRSVRGMIVSCSAMDVGRVVLDLRRNAGSTMLRIRLGFALAVRIWQMELRRWGNEACLLEKHVKAQTTCLEQNASSFLLLRALAALFLVSPGPLV